MVKGKYTAVNSSDTVGKLDSRQSHTLGETLGAEGGNSVGEIQSFQRTAVIEGVIADLLQGRRPDHLGSVLAPHKGIVSDSGDPLGKDDLPYTFRVRIPGRAEISEIRHGAHALNGEGTVFLKIPGVSA